MSIDYDKIYACMISQQWDSVKVAKQLLGSWDLQVTACLEQPLHSDTAEVKITFDDSGSFTALKHDLIVTQGTWKVVGSGQDYQVNLSVSEAHLHGEIILCGDQLLFYDSFVDGCDNLFNRIQ